MISLDKLTFVFKYRSNLKILGIIPARYESLRLHGKPLVDIAGKTMIQRVYEQCLKAKNLTKLIVATDDSKISDAVKSFGGLVMMTSTEHLNGTSRCAEILQELEQLDEYFDFVINIQGDEPLINPSQIDEFVNLFEDETAEIFTQVKKETDFSMLDNSNVVKAIFDKNYLATDFVRILQTSDFNNYYFYKHIGIYGFKSAILKKIATLLPTKNELDHKLEQLRWLDNLYKIKIGETTYDSLSIDTKEDLEKVIKFFNE